ncbi:hypothetical protein HDU80_008777, partial [Chytriomyces hyalinus]
TAHLKETDPSVFMDSLAGKAYQRDLAKKKNGARGRLGSLSQWKRVIAFLSNDPWFRVAIKTSVYSGITLTTLQRAGRCQFSIQNPNDDETYYEAWLRGILVWCASLEKLMLNVPHLKSPNSKEEFLLLLVELWDEGREFRNGILRVPRAALTKNDKRVVAAKHRNQAREYPRYVGGPSRQNRQVTGIEAQESFWESSGLRCDLFGAKGNLTPNSSRLLVIESLINESKYTLEHADNRAMFNFVNKAKEGWRKDIIDEFIKNRPELRSLQTTGTGAIHGELKELVVSRQIAVGDRVYDSIAEYFGMLIVAALMR